MIRALLDTNIVLDALGNRQPFAEDARQLFTMAENGQYEAFLTANTITDIYYVSRKRMPENIIRRHLSSLMKLFDVLPVEVSDCQIALDSQITDYEDALLATIANRWKIDYIITRDEDFLKECKSAIAANSFLNIL